MEVTMGAMRASRKFRFHDSEIHLQPDFATSPLLTFLQDYIVVHQKLSK